MESFVAVLDIMGTIAFAISGAMVGIRKRMDCFGVCVLGVVTATGGGMTRDIILGNNPPQMFRNPRDVIIAAMVSLFTFFVIYFANRFAEGYIHFRMTYSLVLFIMDTLGLAIFTVVGIEVALNLDAQSSGFLLVFVGTITGVGGGLLRDMMSGSIPYIFQKHIYATACIAGAMICVLLYRKAGVELSASMLWGGLGVILIRVLAAYYHWDLPCIYLNTIEEEMLR